MRRAILKGVAVLALSGAAAKAAGVPIDIFDQEFERVFARLNGGATMQPPHCPLPGRCFQDIGWGVALLTHAAGQREPVETATLVSSADHQGVNGRFMAAVYALVALLSPRLNDLDRSALLQGMATDLRKSGTARAAHEGFLYQLRADPDQHIVFCATLGSN